MFFFLCVWNFSFSNFVLYFQAKEKAAEAEGDSKPRPMYPAILQNVKTYALSFKAICPMQVLQSQGFSIPNQMSKLPPT